MLGHILTEQCRSLMPELESELRGIGGGLPHAPAPTVVEAPLRPPSRRPWRPSIAFALPEGDVTPRGVVCAPFVGRQSA